MDIASIIHRLTGESSPAADAPATSASRTDFASLLQVLGGALPLRPEARAATGSDLSNDVMMRLDAGASSENPEGSASSPDSLVATLSTDPDATSASDRPFASSIEDTGAGSDHLDVALDVVSASNTRDQAPGQRSQSRASFSAESVGSDNVHIVSNEPIDSSEPGSNARAERSGSLVSETPGHPDNGGRGTDSFPRSAGQATSVGASSTHSVAPETGARQASDSPAPPARPTATASDLLPPTASDPSDAAATGKFGTRSQGADSVAFSSNALVSSANTVAGNIRHEPGVEAVRTESSTFVSPVAHTDGHATPSADRPAGTLATTPDPERPSPARVRSSIGHTRQGADPQEVHGALMDLDGHHVPSRTRDGNPADAPQPRSPESASTSTARASLSGLEGDEQSMPASAVRKAHELVRGNFELNAMDPTAGKPPTASHAPGSTGGSVSGERSADPSYRAVKHAKAGHEPVATLERVRMLESLALSQNRPSPPESTVVPQASDEIIDSPNRGLVQRVASTIVSLIFGRDSTDVGHSGRGFIAHHSESSRPSGAGTSAPISAHASEPPVDPDQTVRTSSESGFRTENAQLALPLTPTSSETSGPQISADTAAHQNTELLNLESHETSSEPWATEIRADTNNRADRTDAPPSAAGRETSSSRASMAWIDRLLSRPASIQTAVDGTRTLTLTIDDQSGAVTIAARQDADRVVVSVSFTDPTLQASALAQGDEIRQALGQLFDTTVDLSFAQHGEQSQREDVPADRRAPLRHSAGIETADREQVAPPVTQRIAMAGARYEWVG